MCDWGNWRLACTNTRVTDRNVGLRQDHCNHWMETVRLLNSFRHLYFTYLNRIMEVFNIGHGLSVTCGVYGWYLDVFMSFVIEIDLRMDQDPRLTNV